MKTKIKEDGYGTFGNLSRVYDEIRPIMPKNIIDILFANLPIKNQTILDVGCGTGIITRQLAVRRASLTGTDIDSRMLEQAKQHLGKQIDYLVAPTEKLPLPDTSFDAVTAFSAFHWFVNRQALGEIKRVLKNDGIFFIVNRNQVGDIQKKYLNILRTFTQKSLPSVKKDYDPVDLLESAGFSDTSKQIFSVIENLLVEQTLSYIQSTSLWNLVPEKKKGEAITALKSFFERHSQNNIIQRPIEIQLVIGRKKE